MASQSRLSSAQPSLESAPTATPVPSAASNRPRSGAPSRTARYLAALAIFQAGLIAGLVLDHARVIPAAQAQIIPDPAAQQIVTNELLRGIDAKLAGIAQTLASSELKVKVTALPEARK